MKLKAPQGVGNPCVAGVALTARNGLYEVEPEIGALLIECFGFVETGADNSAKVPPRASGAPRRARPSVKKA